MNVDPIRAQILIRRGWRITLAALLALAVVVTLAQRFTPTEVRQGLAQKIFYIHAPSAWCAFLAVGLTGLASILYLWLGDQHFDRFAATSAEVGTIFCAVVGWVQAGMV